MPSTGKLLANMHRSTPNASMAGSSHGAKRVGAHRAERHRQARQLAVRRWSPSAGERVDARLPERALLVGARPRPAGVLDDDDEVVDGRPARGRGLELIGVGHQLEQQAALLQRAEHARRRAAGPSSAPIGRTPRNRVAAICRSMQRDRLGDRVGRRDAADDGVGVAVGLGPRGRARASRRSSGGRSRRRRSRASRRSSPADSAR